MKTKYPTAFMRDTDPGYPESLIDSEHRELNPETISRSGPLPEFRHYALAKHILVVASIPRNNSKSWRATVGVVAGKDHDAEAIDVWKWGISVDEKVARAMFPDLSDLEYRR
jgi:hypothetical protein